MIQSLADWKAVLVSIVVADKMMLKHQAFSTHYTDSLYVDITSVSWEIFIFGFELI